MRLWSVAFGALALDLWSKDWIFKHLDRGEIVEAIPGALCFQRSINPGALFGLGHGLVWVFIIASFVALAFVLYLFAGSRPERRFLHLALSCILAGSMGNLYDRIFVEADKVVLKGEDGSAGVTFYGRIIEGRDPRLVLIGQGLDGGHPVHRLPRTEILEISKVGVVRDFLKFKPQIAGRDVWPWVFNVADSLLVVGVSILMICFWRDRKEHVSAGRVVAPPRMGAEGAGAGSKQVRQAS